MTVGWRLFESIKTFSNEHEFIGSASRVNLVTNKFTHFIPFLKRKTFQRKYQSILWLKSRLKNIPQVKDYRLFGAQNTLFKTLTERNLQRIVQSEIIKRANCEYMPNVSKIFCALK